MATPRLRLRTTYVTPNPPPVFITLYIMRSFFRSHGGFRAQSVFPVVLQFTTSGINPLLDLNPPFSFFTRKPG